MKAIFENYRGFLEEARIDKIKAKYPGKEEIVQNLSSGDPSGNDKYLAWMAQQALKKGHDPKRVVKAIQGFDKNNQRLKKKDIHQYKFDELEIELSRLGTSKTKVKAAKKSGAIKIYEDDNYLFLAPLNKAASCTYGAGTKWCIAATETENFFNQYARRDKVDFVFVLNKKMKQADSREYKLAMVYYSPEQMIALADKLQLDPTEILQNPQEIFDSSDELTCKLTVPESFMYEPELEDVPEHLFRSDGKLQCSDYLDEYFDGQWSAKYRDIILGHLPAVRSGIDAEAEGGKKQILGLYKIILDYSSGEIDWPFRNLEMYIGPHGVQHWLMIDPTMEGRLLQQAHGNTSTHPRASWGNPAAQDAMDKILQYSAVLKFTPENLGLKKPEFSDREKLVFSALRYTDGSDSAVDEYMSSLDDVVKKAIESGGPSAKDLFKHMLEKNMELHQARSSRHLTAAVYGVLTKDYGPNLTDLPRREAGTATFDNRDESLYFKFDPRFMDEYLVTYEQALSVDKDIDGFMKKVRTKLLEEARTNDRRDAEALHRISPDRKYWFWEPV